MTKVVISNYCKKFKDNDLYKNFNVTFYDNNINVIVGPNGSGKTTLINSILGFDKNYLGTITNLTNNLYIFSTSELNK